MIAAKKHQSNRTCDFIVSNFVITLMSNYTFVRFMNNENDEMMCFQFTQVQIYRTTDSQALSKFKMLVQYTAQIDNFGLHSYIKIS